MGYGIIFSVGANQAESNAKMADVRNSDTIVIQSFRKHDIPGWVQRCLDSVRNWAVMHGHDYSLAGDEFFALCGTDYLARGHKDARTITDLARLVATRNRLDDGYRQVIWMDADVFVFDPERLDLSFPAEALPTGYAFGREVWLHRAPSAKSMFSARWLITRQRFSPTRRSISIC